MNGTDTLAAARRLIAGYHRKASCSVAEVLVCGGVGMPDAWQARGICEWKHSDSRLFGGWADIGLIGALGGDSVGVVDLQMRGHP